VELVNCINSNTSEAFIWACPSSTVGSVVESFSISVRGVFQYGAVAVEDLFVVMGIQPGLERG